jgi:hypothetical protein
MINLGGHYIDVSKISYISAMKSSNRFEIIVEGVLIDLLLGENARNKLIELKGEPNDCTNED